MKRWKKKARRKAKAANRSLFYGNKVVPPRLGSFYVEETIGVDGWRNLSFKRWALRWWTS